MCNKCGCRGCASTDWKNKKFIIISWYIPIIFRFVLWQSHRYILILRYLCWIIHLYNHYFKVLSTTYLTLLTYYPLFSWNIWAACAFAGDRGFGSQSNDLMEVRIAHTSYTGLHWFINTMIIYYRTI